MDVRVRYWAPAPSDGEVGHEADDIARGEVLTGLLVVLLVEAPEQLLEDGAHGVVVDAREAVLWLWMRAEVDLGAGELLDEEAEALLAVEVLQVATDTEAIKDLAHVGREAVEVVDEVRVDIGRVVDEPLQCELRGVVEGLAGLLL
jgi:hypothetical protein